VYQAGWSGLSSPEVAYRALSVLEDAEWVRRAEVSTPAGGRPSIVFHINPKSSLTGAAMKYLTALLKKAQNVSFEEPTKPTEPVLQVRQNIHLRDFQGDDATPIVPLDDLIALVERTFPGASLVGIRPRGSGRKDA
jgi:hypothetical protein